MTDDLTQNIEMFTLLECRDWLIESGIDADDWPKPNPWTMDTEDLRELIGSEGFNEPPEVLLDMAIERIDNCQIDGIDCWRAACLEVPED